MFKIGNIEINNAILLAPMEDVTDVSFRLICKKLGADVVYTEFINSEGIVRGSEKTKKKMEIVDEERPIGIQIYGGVIESMIGAAKVAEENNPELIDINAGCWVKNVVGCGAGAGLLKDPDNLQKMVKVVVDNVSLPVTVKTRIGWDQKTIHILEIAKRLEDVGVKALTVHCRTRQMGHRGDPDWTWIPKIKEVVSIPVVLNGGVMTAYDVIRAFSETGADGVMIARGAIGYPWIFKEAKELLNSGKVSTEIDFNQRIDTCIEHLSLAIQVKGERRAVIEHRKFYSGYLKGLRNSSYIRNSMMQFHSFNEVIDLLNNYREFLTRSESVNAFE